MKDNKDLEFLRLAENDDLKVLVDYLTKTKEGDIRLTEGLTMTNKYRKYYPDNIKEMLDCIVDELQLDGGNTIFNMFRGCGVSYREILVDVANKMDVNFNSKASVDIIEMNLLQKILMDSMEKFIVLVLSLAGRFITAHFSKNKV